MKTFCSSENTNKLEMPHFSPLLIPHFLQGYPDILQILTPPAKCQHPFHHLNPSPIDMDLEIVSTLTSNFNRTKLSTHCLLPFPPFGTRKSIFSLQQFHGYFLSEPTSNLKPSANFLFLFFFFRKLPSTYQDKTTLPH